MTLALGGTIQSMPGLGDQSARQYTFVTQDTDGRVGDPGANSVITGILQNKPAATDRAAAIQIDGVSKLVLGGTASQGDRLKTDTSGAGVATTTASDNVGAVALEDGVSGDTIAVRVMPYAFGA